MNVIKFKECNVTFAKNQPPYLPLPAYRDANGMVTSCWGLGLKERIKVLFTGKMYLNILTFNQPLQPVRLMVDNPVKGN